MSPYLVFFIVFFPKVVSKLGKEVVPKAEYVAVMKPHERVAPPTGHALNYPSALGSFGGRVQRGWWRVELDTGG